MSLENFRYRLPMTVRFADLDVLGHLNNVTYLSYTEQARIAYVRDVCGWQGSWEQLGMILARTEVDYLLPIGFGDSVEVHIRISRLGGKSFDFEYIITRQGGEQEPEIAAKVKSVMVAYDYEGDSSIPVPDSWREQVLAYEPSLSA